MVSRGSASNILKGIHLSMADRLARLLKTLGAKDGKLMMTGGLVKVGGGPTQFLTRPSSSRVLTACQ